MTIETRRAPLAHVPGMAERLNALVAAVLKIEDGPRAEERYATHSFIELGGNSLLAMLLVARAAEELGVDVPVSSLLSRAPLGVALAEAQVVDHRPTESTEAGPSTAPSPVQRGIWAAEQLVGRALYNLVFVAFTDAALDERIVKTAIARTVERHEGLRTIFRIGTRDLERHVISDGQPQVVTIVAPDDHSFEEFVRTIASEHAGRPFNLDQTPPLRFLLVSGSASQSALVLLTHHMLLDASSIGLAFKEIFSHYHAVTSGESCALPAAPKFDSQLMYHQHLRESGEIDTQRAYWHGRLYQVPTTLDLPADRPRPAVQQPSGLRLPFEFSPEHTGAVRQLAQDLGVTPFAYLLASFGVLLARHTGQQRFLVGTPVAGRPTSELRQLIAECTTVVPVLMIVDEDASVAEHVRAVQRSVTESLNHSDAPFNELVREIVGRGDLSRNPLIQIVFSMYDEIGWDFQVGPLAVRIAECHAGGAPMDLTLAIQRAEPSFAGILEFATGVWSRREAEGFLADFLTITTEVLDPNVRVEDVRGIAPVRRELQASLNLTAHDYPALSIDHVFREHVERQPDSPAVRAGGTCLTYLELHQAASRQARRLLDAGVGPRDKVAVGLGRSIAEVVAVLGALYVGAAYVAIDEDLPAQRFEHLVRRARPVAAIADDQLSLRFKSAGVQVVESWRPSWSEESHPEIGASPRDPDRLAYIVFTSGSTGIPKGVCATHRGVVRLVRGVDYLLIGSMSRFLRFVPLSFDASTLELWAPLLNGASLEIYPPGIPSPVDLGRFIAERGVTTGWLTAGLFRLLAEFSPTCFANVQQIVVGGDVVPPEHVAAVLRANPGLLVTNGYGPAENTCFTTAHAIPNLEAVESPLPIGRPISNTSVYILDERHRLLPPGATGELYTGGDGLALGYFDDPEETARHFGRFSPDVDEVLYRTGDMVRLDSRARLQFLGRHDEQVKIGGMRVELEEVRLAVSAHPAIQDAVVVATDAFGPDKVLLAGYVPRPGTAVSAAELRDQVASRLPRYMVPSRWVAVPQIPVTRNGKVDREALVTAARSPTAPGA
jgi:amino acid adenylation domain-containing protein